MFTIGEFSSLSGLSVKTLRFYHERGLLVPTTVDPDNGYRFYADEKLDRARVIRNLRELDFSLEEISEILQRAHDDEDLISFLERKQVAITDQVERMTSINQSLRRIIQKEKEARRIMKDQHFEIEEKVIDDQLIGFIEMTGRYDECGQGFSRIGRRFGRHLAGKALLLVHDTEYKEEGARFDVCMPIKKGEGRDDIGVKTLCGGHCLALIHQGPYDTISHSYARIMAEGKNRGLKTVGPSREVYLKGPGMIFKGNPKKYLTEIQFFYELDSPSSLDS